VRRIFGAVRVIKAAYSTTAVTYPFDGASSRLASRGWRAPHLRAARVIKAAYTTAVRRPFEGTSSGLAYRVGACRIFKSFAQRA